MGLCFGVDVRSFCVNLHRFCGENCEATASKLLIPLNGFRTGCEAIAAKLLILFESCGTACFSGKNGAAQKCRRKNDTGDWRRARVWLYFVMMIPIRTFPIESYIDCAPERAN